jgi:hypothetical protein
MDAPLAVRCGPLRDADGRLLGVGHDKRGQQQRHRKPNRRSSKNKRERQVLSNYAPRRFIRRNPSAGEDSFVAVSQATRYGTAWQNVTGVLPPRMVKLGVQVDF